MQKCSRENFIPGHFILWEKKKGAAGLSLYEKQRDNGQFEIGYMRSGVAG